MLNKEFRVEGSIELLLTDETYRDLYLDGTQKAMRLKLASPVTIGVSSNPTLQIDLAKIKITEFGRSGGNNDLVRQALSITGYFSIDEDSMATAKLTNEEASY